SPGLTSKPQWKRATSPPAPRFLTFSVSCLRSGSCSTVPSVLCVLFAFRFLLHGSFCSLCLVCVQLRAPRFLPFSVSCLRSGSCSTVPSVLCVLFAFRFLLHGSFRSLCLVCVQVSAPRFLMFSVSGLRSRSGEHTSEIQSHLY